MSKREEYISFVSEIKSIFPIISDGQRKELLRRAVQQYNVSVDDAVDILKASGLVIGDQKDFFEVLGLSVSDFDRLSETEIVDRVETAHKRSYGESLKAGGRPRADGKSEAEWRTVLNQARDTLIDVEKRDVYIKRYENRESHTNEIISDDGISSHDQSVLSKSDYEVESISTEDGEMVLVPAGDFQMGSDEDDAPENEKPAHTVYLDEFYIDKYPVTNEQYSKFVDANPHWNNLGMYNFQFILRKYRDNDYLKEWFKGKYPRGKENHPVNWVSWHAAMAYAKWVGKRLPTEAEWEKAARGRLVGNKYPWGNAIYTENANFGRNIGETTPVGQYPVNFYGVFDIVGNVSEWCLDEWTSNFYKLSKEDNPVSGGSINRILDAYLTSTRKKRVIRGGSWNSKGNDVRVSHRDRIAPWKTYSFVGFRCVTSNRS